MHQLLLGAALPYLIAAAIYIARRGRASLALLALTPAAMAAGAAWAAAPDLPRLLGMQTLYERLARDPRTNVFFWHYSIDQVEVDSVWYIVPLVLILASLLAAAWRELRMRERGL